MDHIKRRMLVRALKAFDIAVMILCFTGVTILLYSGGEAGTAFRDFLSMRISLRNLAIGLIIVFAWQVIFSLFSLYESTRSAKWFSIFSSTAKATTVASLFFVVVAHFFRISMASRRFEFLFWISSSAILTAIRLTLHFSLRAIRRRGRNLRNVLIIGSNARALAFASQIRTSPELGYHVLGFVDNAWTGFDYFRSTNNVFCCNIDGLPAYLRRNVVDEVAMYLPLHSCYREAAEIVTLCEEHGIVVRFDSEIFNLNRARLRAVELDGNSHLTTSVGSPDGWPAVAKRGLDLIVSGTVLLLLAPVFALVAALVMATSRGPVFFLQERVGLNKRRFRIYKFRTMVVNAEQMMEKLAELNEVSGPVFKIKNDPRLTPIGSFLRRTSIDELPQLLNVLRGDMSLVGPRPLPLRDYEGFSEDWQRRRFSVRPGITCLWQVNGRSSISFDQWMKLDLQYMDQWSLWLDLKILVRTVPAVLKGSGAA